MKPMNNNYKTFEQRLEYLNNVTSELDRALYRLDQTQKGLVKLMGVDAVKAAIQAVEWDETKARFDANEATLKEGVEKGYVTAGETVTESCILTGRMLNSEGQPIEGFFPDFNEAYLSNRLAPHIKPALLGMKTGEIKDLGYGKVEITGIWEVDVEKLKAHAELEAKAAAAPSEVVG